MDALLGNVEFQHHHAAQLNTHANGVAERWVESCRGDLCDRLIPVTESRLKRLLNEYVHYYHEDPTHLDLAKQTPGLRIGSHGPGRVISFPRLGGLHHRYERAA